MKLEELQQKLIRAARTVPPDDRVPYAFERRVLARLKEGIGAGPLGIVGARFVARRGAVPGCDPAAGLLVMGDLRFRRIGARFFPGIGEHRPCGGGPGSTGGNKLVNVWKIILATLVIFGAGVVTGGLLVRYSHQMPVAPRRAVVRQPSSLAGMRLEFLRRAQRELDLSPGQRQRIDLVLKESQERTRKLMQPVEPQLRQELQRTRDRFREALTPEQQVKFDQLVKRPQRMRDSRQQREGRNPSPDRQPPIVPPPTQ